MADKYVPKLGDTVTDNVTGMAGIVIGVLTRLHETKTYDIQPAILKDGVSQPTIWLPAGRLDHVPFD
jgi:hypothetical protein